MRHLGLRSLATAGLVSLAAVMLAACGGGGEGGDDASFEGTTVRSEDGRLTVQVPDGAAPDGVEVEIARIEDGDLPAELQDNDEIRGDDGGDSVEGTTVRSEDGRLTVQVPEGAAADGVEVTVTRIEDGDLPVEVRDVGAVVMGYELSPDGAEFAEPLKLTFRLDPSDIGLDLPDGGVPLGLLLTESAAGDLESLGGAELSRVGDQIVAQVAVTHFSPAILVLSNNTALVLTPPEVEMEVGETRTVTVIGRDLGTGDSGALESIGLDGRRALWGVMDPFTFELLGPTASATERYGIALSCTARTDGWVTAAYDVIVDGGEIDRIIDQKERGLLLAVFGRLDIFGHVNEIAGTKLAGDGKCNAAEETPTPNASSADGGGSSSVELNGANAAGQTSGDIAGAVGGCEDGESKEAECVPYNRHHRGPLAPGGRFYEPRGDRCEPRGNTTGRFLCGLHRDRQGN